MKRNTLEGFLKHLYYFLGDSHLPSRCVDGTKEGVSETLGSGGAKGGSRVTVSLTPDPLCPQIYFWEAQRRNLTERVKTLFLAENGVKLKNLTGYTAYMVSVAAFNAAGDGPRSTPARGQTQQAGGGQTGGTDGGEGGWHLASAIVGEWRQLSDLGWVPGPRGTPSRVGERSPPRGA